MDAGSGGVPFPLVSVLYWEKDQRAQTSVEERQDGDTSEAEVRSRSKLGGPCKSSSRLRVSKQPTFMTLTLAPSNATVAPPVQRRKMDRSQNELHNATTYHIGAEM